MEEGNKYGRLLVLSPAPRDKYRGKNWLCICDCGEIKTVRQYSLRSGHTKSCGCLQRDTTSKICTIHGEGAKITSEYRIWKTMIQRCYNSRRKGYKNYGGRGIIVCERWRHSYINFLEDMGRRPSKDYSLDRIDNDGDYEPNNCRWATQKQQRNNTRFNNIIEMYGVAYTLAEWANILGVPYNRLVSRRRRGWSTEDILFKPKMGQGKVYIPNE